MKQYTKKEIQEFLADRYADQFNARGYKPISVPESLDLLKEGIIDSLGIMELISALEEKFGQAIDFADLDPDQLTVFGPLCSYIQTQLNAQIKQTVAG